MILLEILKSDGVRESRSVLKNSTFGLSEGDCVAFAVPSRTVSAFHHAGPDLVLDFDEGLSITLERFFVSNNDRIDTVVNFDDTLFTATELADCFHAEHEDTITLKQLQARTHKQANNVLHTDGRMRGSETFRAVEEVPFVYHFDLSKDFPTDAKVNLLLANKPAPPWLSVRKVGERQYVISGVPKGKHVGELALSIVVES